MTAVDARVELGRLAAERLEAIEAGLAHNEMYMRRIEQELTAARSAYVGLAVTEIATLRGQLDGPRLG